MKQDFVRTQYTPEQQAANRDAEMKQALLEEMGMEDRDAVKLRKTLLSSEEAIAAKTEQMDDIRARKCRKPDWDEYVDAKRRWGRALHHSDLLRGLRRLISGLYVCDGRIKNTLGLYVWDKTQKFESKIGGTVFQGWCHLGWNPEYEVDIVNDVGVAISQKRGWRTLAVRMICRRDAETFYPKSLFSEEDFLAEFGAPTNGETATKYRQHMWKWRNTTPSRARMEHAILEASQKHKYS